MWERVLRLSPFAPGEALGARPAKPHDPASMAEVRRLIETRALSYRAIARRTGVPRSTISRHVLEGGWIRPMTDLLPPPTPQGERRARRGELADRILRAAEN